MSFQNIEKFLVCVQLTIVFKFCFLESKSVTNPLSMLQYCGIRLDISTRIQQGQFNECVTDKKCHMHMAMAKAEKKQKKHSSIVKHSGD